MKSIEYVKEQLVDTDVIAPAKETVYDLVIKSRRQAFKDGIEANAIVINENMVKVPEFYMPDFRGAIMTNPMICGLNVYWTANDLPDNYSFALLNDGKGDRLRRFESIGMEPEELKKAAELYRLMKETFADEKM